MQAVLESVYMHTVQELYVDVRFRSQVTQVIYGLFGQRQSVFHCGIPSHILAVLPLLFASYSLECTHAHLSFHCAYTITLSRHFCMLSKEL